MLIFGLIIVAIAIIFAVIYNGLIGKRNKVKNQWSQIEVQLKRRFDLIPNLVESVKGYASHESETRKQSQRPEQISCLQIHRRKNCR
jgi:LemA protein